MARLSVAQRRDTAISAAMRVIARDGVEAATTRRIADEAQIAQSSLFYAFASRDELLAEVVERGIAEELAAMGGWTSLASTLFAAGASVSDVFTSAFDVYIADLERNRDREAALVELALYARRTAGLEHLAERLYRSYYALVAGLLDDAAAATGLRWRLPTMELATIVVGITDGLTLCYLNTGDRVLAQRIAGSGVDLLLGYIATN